MKTAFIFLAVGFLLLFFLLKRTVKDVSAKSIDIYLYDKYYILEWWHFILLVMLFGGTIFCFGGLVGNAFRSKHFLIALGCFIAADVWMLNELI